MARIFTGDYSTGNLSQFDGVINKFVNKGGSEYHTQGAAGQYPVQVVAGTCGYAARFEVRPGDLASGPNERSEVRATSSRVALGGTAWYAFSMKFDKTWPTNQTSLGWLVVGQFGYFPDMPSSPVISFGNGLTAGPGTRDGYFYLMQNPQTPKPGGGYNYVSPTGYALAIAEFPLNVGQWHDFKMQAKWATDSTGFINLWHNGSRVTFTADGGGGQTFTGQTALASGQGSGESVTHVCVSHGIYREPNVSPTGVMHYTGLRVADNETSL